jgi:hypothetical protein
MAEIGFLHRWERYAPDLGDNRQRANSERLWIEVKSSMTRAELDAFNQSIVALHRERGERLGQHMKAVHDLEPTEAKAKTDAFLEELLQFVADSYVAALRPCVRLVGRHTLGGKPCESLDQYIAILLPLSDAFNIIELLDVVKAANSVSGTTALFSERRSGGWVGTPRQTAAED